MATFLLSLPQFEFVSAGRGSTPPLVKHYATTCETSGVVSQQLNSVVCNLDTQCKSVTTHCRL